MVGDTKDLKLLDKDFYNELVSACFGEDPLYENDNLGCAGAGSGISLSPRQEAYFSSGFYEQFLEPYEEVYQEFETNYGIPPQLQDLILIYVAVKKKEAPDRDPLEILERLGKRIWWDIGLHIVGVEADEFKKAWASSEWAEAALLYIFSVKEKEGNVQDAFKYVEDNDVTVEVLRGLRFGLTEDECQHPSAQAYIELRKDRSKPWAQAKAEVVLDYIRNSDPAEEDTDLYEFQQNIYYYPTFQILLLNAGADMYTASKIVHNKTIHDQYKAGQISAEQALKFYNEEKDKFKATKKSGFSTIFECLEMNFQDILDMPTASLKVLRELKFERLYALVDMNKANKGELKTLALDTDKLEMMIDMFTYRGRRPPAHEIPTLSYVSKMYDLFMSGNPTDVRKDAFTDFLSAIEELSCSSLQSGEANLSIDTSELPEEEVALEGSNLVTLGLNGLDQRLERGGEMSFLNPPELNTGDIVAPPPTPSGEIGEEPVVRH